MSSRTLVRALPRELRSPRVHPLVVDDERAESLRAAGVPRRRRARSRRRRGALPPLPRRGRGAAREAARLRRLAAARAPSWRARSTSATAFERERARRGAERAASSTSRNVLAALLRVGDRRRVPRTTATRDRRGGHRGLPRAHRIRRRAGLRRSQDGAAGTPGTSGVVRKLRADGSHRPSAPPQLHHRRDRRRRRSLGTGEGPSKKTSEQAAARRRCCASTSEGRLCT